MSDSIDMDLAVRTDGWERVTGRIEFGVNQQFDAALHAAIYRSPVPHGRITAIDITHAQELEGVVRIITGDDARTAMGNELRLGDQPVLAVDMVRYVGEPVALVLARSQDIAREAVRQIELDVDELPHVTSIETAMAEGATQLHVERPNNIAGSWQLRHGNVADRWDECDHIFSDVYQSPSASHVPMEPHVVIADASGHESVSIRTATQAPYMVRAAVAGVLGMDEDAVLVQGFNVGGAFGAKLEPKVECLAAIGSWMAGAQVRLELTREDVFYTIAKHEASVEITTGVTSAGKVLARKVKVIYNGGAYAKPGSARSGMLRAAGPYAVADVELDAVTCYSNTVPAGAMRGSMTTQLVFAYESQMDDIAHALGLSPMAIRSMNLVRNGDTYITGDVIEQIYFDEILDDLATSLDGFAAVERAGDAADNPDVVRGTGFAIMIKTTGTPSLSQARLRLRDSGAVELHTASVEMGQGAHLLLRRIVADVLGAPVTDVTHVIPQTGPGQFDSMTASSRTAFSMGTATRRAAEAMRDTLQDLVGIERSGTEPQATLLAKALHSMRAAGTDELWSTGEYQSVGGPALLDPETSQGPNPTVHWHQGGAAVEVEVDLSTGKVRVLQCHGVAYAGKVLDTAGVRAQNDGCVVLGIGTTLFEELEYIDGSLANPNLAEYLIPSAADVPIQLGSSALESPHPDAEPHGVGEMVIPAMAPAIGNAIRNATRARIRDLPFDGERVLSALERLA